MAIVSTTRKDATILEAVLLPTTTSVLVLRFLARRRLHTKLWWDDWFALIAWIILTAHFIFSFWSDRAGVGAVIDGRQPTLDDIVISLKVVFADVYLFCFTITAARLSLVFLYQRIFGIYRWMHRLLWVIGILSIAWLLNSCLLIAFECHPTSAFWDPLKMGTNCLNLNTIFVITESINCGLDFSLVLLPLGRIRQLQLSLKERVALGAVFLTGAFVCITSILRIIVNYDVDTVKSLFWLDLQIGFAVICSNLPPLRTFLPKTSPSTTTVGSFVSSMFRKQASKTSSYKSEETAVHKNSTGDDHVPLSQVWVVPNNSNGSIRSQDRT